MPLHDRSRVPAGLFHHFHQDWTIEIARTLNRGRLPKGVSALVEQKSEIKEPDVLAIEKWRRSAKIDPSGNGIVATLEPQRPALSGVPPRSSTPTGPIVLCSSITWAGPSPSSSPEEFRLAVETGVAPNPDAE